MLNFKNKKLCILLPTFLVAELCLWFVILFCPHSALGLSISCFSAVALAFVFALCFIKKDTGVLLLISGLLFTVCADIFLVLPQDLQYKQQVAGMIFFSVTQLVYFAYLFWKTESKKIYPKKQSLSLNFYLYCATIKENMCIRGQQV